MKAILSSTFYFKYGWSWSYRHSASLCIDGNVSHCRQQDTCPISVHLDTCPEERCTACATHVEKAPWFAIDYGTEVMIERVEIINRKSLGHRTRNMDVRVSDELPTSSTQMFSGGTLLGHFDGPATDNQQIIISGQKGNFSCLLIIFPLTGEATPGRYVIVQLNAKTNLKFEEVKAFGTLANTNRKTLNKN